MNAFVDVPQYSVVIPCYRSGSILAELIQRLLKVFAEVPGTCEILLVNDASPDSTWMVISELAEQHPEVRGLDLYFNTGQYRAILCGLERAAGDVIILMDDDLQHPPEEIPKLLQALESHPEWDCVMGRYRVKHHSWLRNLGSRFFGWMNTRLYGKPRDLFGSSFQAMRRSLALAVCAHQTTSPILNPLIYRTTRRLGNVEVEHHRRKAGTSGYTLGKLIWLVVNNFLSASHLPLRAISILGLSCALLSAVLGTVYLVLYWMRDITVPGFATLVLLVIFFGGTSLLAIGIVGEYLLQILAEVRRGPRYLVREDVGGRTPAC